MIDRNHDLPVKRQAELVGISRGSVYYRPTPVSAADLALMRVIDELHLEYPFAGARMLRDMLRARGFEVGRKHVATLMRRMGIEALYRRPNTSKPRMGPPLTNVRWRDMAGVKRHIALGARFPAPLSATQPPEAAMARDSAED